MPISNCLPAYRQTGSRLLLKIREDFQFGVYLQS